ncbi:glycosyltransferase family 4 protein [Peptococcaceae bacterium]|nr:glycosyltransferase family 4 protein [Peptococcaceae bacterium]
MNIVIDARAAQYTRVGIAVYVVNLVNSLAELYPEHRFLLLTSPKLREPEIRKASNIIFLPEAPGYQEYITQDWWDQVKLPGLLRRVQADLYHSPSYILPFLRSSPCPLVATMYDANVFALPDMHKKLASYRLKYFIRRSAAKANALVFGSHHAKSEYRSFLGDNIAHKGEVIYISVPGEIKPENLISNTTIAAVKSKFKIKRPYLMSIGTLHPRKNYERLIETLTKPVLAGYDLVICGNKGWHTRYTEKIFNSIEKLRLQDRVKITGFVETREMKVLLKGAALMVYPSLYEGFGIPPLEAFALGVPVCASNTTSIPEVVGEAAVLFDPYSVDAMTKAIAQVLNDGKLQKHLIAKGYERLKYFSWEKCAREHMNIYEKVVQAR